MGRVALLKEEEVLASWYDKTFFFFYDGSFDTANPYKIDDEVVGNVSNVPPISFF